MKSFDWLCAGALFVLAIAGCLLVPKEYTGRIWILGTTLSLLFTAMLNVVRLRNSCAVKSLRLTCFTANVTMLVFTISLMASIGGARSQAHPQIPFVGVLLLAETVFSFGKNA